MPYGPIGTSSPHHPITTNAPLRPDRPRADPDAEAAGHAADQWGAGGGGEAGPAVPVYDSGDGGGADRLFGRGAAGRADARRAAGQDSRDGREAGRLPGEA